MSRLLIGFLLVFSVLAPGTTRAQEDSSTGGGATGDTGGSTSGDTGGSTGGGTSATTGGNNTATTGGENSTTGGDTTATTGGENTTTTGGENATTTGGENGTTTGGDGTTTGGADTTTTGGENTTTAGENTTTTGAETTGTTGEETTGTTGAETNATTGGSNTNTPETVPSAAPVVDEAGAERTLRDAGQTTAGGPSPAEPPPPEPTTPPEPTPAPSPATEPVGSGPVPVPVTEPSPAPSPAAAPEQPSWLQRQWQEFQDRTIGGIQRDFDKFKSQVEREGFLAASADVLRSVPPLPMLPPVARIGSTGLALTSDAARIATTVERVGVTAERTAVAGLGAEEAAAAFQGMRGGGGHAMRRLVEDGVIENSGSLASRAAKFEELTSGVLQNPTKPPFDWRMGTTPARGYIGDVGGKQMAVFVATEGPYAGKVISTVPATAADLALWGVQ